ncbi:hypothetical protein AJ88_16225 [Mesorhizobium amorphae CCBAU 01583]|nr:hypothetical protein AJ88_16225 [Mesorhizobium amorphae CCBAU 01583]
MVLASHRADAALIVSASQSERGESLPDAAIPQAGRSAFQPLNGHTGCLPALLGSEKGDNRKNGQLQEELQVF